MDQRRRSYTLEEIEELTGFDKRTIAYYVQEDVLPKVGRRGPRTRYPQLFLDRLLFIKRVRDLQDSGRVGTMTLGDFRAVFDRLSAREVADLAAGHEPIEPVAEAFHEPLLAEPRMAAASRRLELMAERFQEALQAPDASREPASFERGARFRLGPPGAGTPDSPSARRLGRLLADVERSSGAHENARDGVAERWTRARVTPDITISARNLEEGGADLLEEVARLLRLLMGAADRE